MNTYSQNKEDLQVAAYFTERTGTLLSIGENNGVTFSNAKLLIEYAWTAHLFEPSSVCGDLLKLHKGNDNVHIYNKGMGDTIGSISFYESGAHVKGGSDRALVSTTDHKETIRWRKAGVQFTEKKIQVVDFKGWYAHLGSPVIEYVTIDCEGGEWAILQQMDFGIMGTEFLVIEWNGDKGLERKFTAHCLKFGLTECGRNGENLMFNKKI